MSKCIELKENVLEATSGGTELTPTAMHCENCLYHEGGVKEKYLDGEMHECPICHKKMFHATLNY